MGVPKPEYEITSEEEVAGETTASRKTSKAIKLI
jgi:hypothetical protein